jgi:hypothetical protein
LLDVLDPLCGFLAFRGHAQRRELFGRLLDLLESVEEPVKNIPAGGRDEKNVGVRNPAPARVHCDELGLEGRAKPVRHLMGEAEDAGRLLRRKLVPPRHVPLGKDQRVARGERLDVENRERLVVFVDPLGRGAAGDDLAEDAGDVVSGRQR